MVRDELIQINTDLLSRIPWKQAVPTFVFQHTDPLKSIIYLLSALSP